MFLRTGPVVLVALQADISLSMSFGDAPLKGSWNLNLALKLLTYRIG